MERKHSAKDILKNTLVPETVRNDTENLVSSMLTHPGYGNENYPWSINDFEIGKHLGDGKFGRVYVAREKKTNFLVALKTMSKTELTKSHCEKQILREIEIQTHLQHPNILRLLTWFHDEHRIYLVLEFAAKGEVYGHLQQAEYFDDHRAAKYIYQVADALHYCHTRKVIHRDLKPENLLLTASGNVKLADFGWSVHAPQLSRKTLCGTVDYLPVEMVKGMQYGPLVDNWCVGILLYEFLVGSPPFESKNNEDTYEKIKQLAIKYPPHVSLGAKDLISKLLVPDSIRISLPEVMNHPWVQANK